MPKLFSFLIILFISHFNHAAQIKEFEGVVTYNKELVRHASDKFALSYEEAMRDQGEGDGTTDYYYKNGMHKWADSKGTMELFLPKLKFLYIKTKAEYKNWVKSPIKKSKVEEIIEFKVLDEVDTILDYPCKVLKITTKFNYKYGGKTIRYFYFNKSLYMNYKTKKSYRLNFQYEIAKEIQSIPLKIVVFIKGCELTYTALKVEEKAIEDKVFEVPPTAF